MPVDCDHLARLLLAAVARPYPYAPQHVYASAHEVADPRQLHPAFGGCFDWHSAVHSHWSIALLAQLTVLDPELHGAAVAALDRHLNSAAIAAEAAYLQRPHAQYFEAPYGWAWLLALTALLDGNRHSHAPQWAAAVEPLASLIGARLPGYFARLALPLRGGLHHNSAFALTLSIDATDRLGERALGDQLRQTALRLFAQDRSCPTAYEPSGTDFLSPCLAEAELMARVLPADRYRQWLDRFLPASQLAPLRQEVAIADGRDGQLVHLYGLVLQRAWAMHEIARLVPDRPLWQQAAAQARASAEHAIAPALAGGYEATHWLPTFVLYFLVRTDQLQAA